MPVELAALIVALLWGAVTAMLALRGKKEIENANPDLPSHRREISAQHFAPMPNGSCRPR